MNKIVGILWIGCLSVLLAGCMHTVVGTGLGDASPDGRFLLALQVHGASGQAYTDKTKKRMYVWVTPSGTNNPTPVFTGNYVFIAAGLDWKVHWLSTSEVAVELIDYGDGESNYSPHRSITNHIAQLTFTQVAGVFVEKK
jgi:hypothetical protein